MSFLTYQDFETVKPEELSDFVKRAIAEHKASVEYEIALTADQYDKKRNTTICNYVQTLWISRRRIIKSAPTFSTY